MSLTVPKAGISPGRAPQLANVPMPQSDAGATLAAFGDRMAQLGGVLEDERLGREMTRLKTGMTKDLGELRLSIEDMGDPDQAGAAWDSGLQSLRQKYLDGADENGRPLVDPKLREDFGLAFDDLSTTHGLAIGGRLLGLRRSQRAANLYDYTNTVVGQAAISDADTQVHLFSELDAEIDASVARGDMTPEEGAIAKRRNREDTDSATAIEMGQNDPAGLVQLIDAGGLSNLGPEDRARHRASAQADLDRIALAEIKDAEARDKELRSEWGKRLDDVAAIATGGQRSVDEFAWLRSQQVAEIAERDADFALKRDKALAAVQLRDESPGLARATPDDLETMLEQERARPLRAPFEARRMEILQQQYTAAVEGWRKDPIAYARKVGMKVPELDLSNNSDIPAQLARRVAFSQWLDEKNYATDPGLLDDDEQVRLSTAIGAIKDPEERAIMVGGIATGVIRAKGDPTAIAAIAKDPVTNWVAMSMASENFGPALGGEILRGQDAIDAKTMIMPPIAERTGATFDVLSDMFAGIPGGERMQAQLVAATDALYASRVRNVDPTADLDTAKWMQALHEVIGGQGEYNSRRQRGGVQTVNDRKTFLPAGVSSSMIEEAFKSLAGDIRGPTAGGNVQRTRNWIFKPERAETVMQSIANGNRAGINGRALTPDEWEDAQIVQVGPDEYALLLNFGGGLQAQNVDTGEPFTFSLSALLNGYRRRVGK
ncbi:MAG: hypothetical protein PHX82_14295 [Paracoccaceae bacterium]|nr:hypothetical protein [Paracoccaceae bacterium]